jgi:hypothetical protein
VSSIPSGVTTRSLSVPWASSARSETSPAWPWTSCVPRPAVGGPGIELLEEMSAAGLDVTDADARTAFLKRKLGLGR